MGSLRWLRSQGSIDATVNKQPVIALLKECGLARSTYYYHASRDSVPMADSPFEKIITDITEFLLNYGKVYILPALDLFVGPRSSTTTAASTNELANGSP